MPKEYVDDYFKSADSRVRVGWSKESGDVQIATTAPDDWTLDPMPEGNGWFVNLDRQGINRLIRILRQARDDAYGADA